MTCRIARASHSHPCTDSAICCACGSANLEVCATSKILGPHVCESCAQSRVEHGMTMGMAVSPEGVAITTSTGVSWDHA
jgi:hypothetical protein